VDPETLLAVTGLADLLAGKPRRLTVASAEQAAGIPKAIRRAVRKFIRGEDRGSEAIDRPAFDYDHLLEQLSAEVRQPVIERVIDGLPADAETQTGYLVAVQRAIGYLRGGMPVRSTVTATGVENRRPPDIEVARFRRAWEVAEDPLVVLADLEAGRLVPDQVRALSAMYPEIYGAIRLEVLDAIADARADKSKWKLPLTRDRRLQVLLGASTMTPALAADIQRVFAPTEKVAPPSGPPSSHAADALKTPAQRAQDR
jgi:hypothetical protein